MSGSSTGRLASSRQQDAGTEETVEPKLTLRDQQKMLTRSKLLESAQEVFDAKGYSRATVGDIVAGAGASHGTFYLYFPTKSSVIVELMETGWGTDVAQHLNGLSAIADPSAAQLTKWIQGFLDIYEAHAGQLRAWAQASAEEHDLVNQTDNYIRLMVDGVADAMKKHAGRQASRKNADVVAMTLVFELERVCFFKFVRRWEIPDAIVGVLATQWSAVLSGETHTRTSR